jgi:hypothetical protein
MGNPVDAQGYELEVLGQCMTNSRAGSQHTQVVPPDLLWSYAQEEALVAVSEQGADKCWRLIADPERRAKRIAARYADLYFASAEKSRGKLQLYWPGLAAFVVKDIVEAYRYSRDEVLSGGWRNWDMAKLGSMAMTGSMPYELALRVYAALAKGNIWLFMDIYPWLWFTLEYGLNDDGTLNEQRLQSHMGVRNTETLQNQSRTAVQELPFNANWLGRLQSRMAADPVWAEAQKIASPPPGPMSGLGMGPGVNPTTVPHGMAHRYVKQNVQNYDQGYRLPPSKYWNKFSEAFYVMESERAELARIAADAGALDKLKAVAKFAVTSEMKNTYSVLIEEYRLTDLADKFDKQKKELVEIAKQEQLNVLQPLIYDDPKLISVMDQNHQLSRRFGSWLSPKYAVVYSAQPKVDDPTLQTVFDPPTGAWNRWVEGTAKSLPNPADRMDFVALIAEDYNRLMEKKRSYMEGELQKIRGWFNA